MIHLEINDIENEKLAVVSFYKKQIEAFRNIKKECEKVEWDDANYDAFVVSMNAIGESLAKIIQTLSDGRDVYIISELLLLGQEYMSIAKKFPKV